LRPFVQPDFGGVLREESANGRLARLGFKLHLFRHGLTRGIKEGWYRMVRAPLGHLAWLGWCHLGVPGDRQLSRRCALAHVGDQTLVWVPPRSLQHWVRFGNGATRRRFFWTGDWDLDPPRIEDHDRYQMMADIWHNREDLRQSEAYQSLMARIERGDPRRIMNKGYFLDTEARVLAWLEELLDLFRILTEEGFRLDKGPDELNVAIGRDGTLLKANAGRKRTMISHILGLERIPVRIAYIHLEWWHEQAARYTGNREQRLRAALADYLAQQGFERAG